MGSQNNVPEVIKSLFQYFSIGHFGKRTFLQLMGLIVTEWRVGSKVTKGLNLLPIY